MASVLVSHGGVLGGSLALLLLFCCYVVTVLLLLLLLSWCSVAILFLLVCCVERYMKMRVRDVQRHDAATQALVHVHAARAIQISCAAEKHNLPPGHVAAQHEQLL